LVWGQNLFFLGFFFTLQQDTFSYRRKRNLVPRKTKFLQQEKNCFVTIKKKMKGKKQP